jgi:hypothetical protein
MMILDTDAKTVTFVKPQTLTLAQLWSLIELLDDDVEDDAALSDVLVKLSNNAAEFGRHNIGITKIHLVDSDTRLKVYSVVEFEDGTWACSCPDWVHRRSEDDTNCKHIKRLMSSQFIWM